MMLAMWAPEACIAAARSGDKMASKAAVRLP
jgi:hypothetical protein